MRLPDRLCLPDGTSVTVPPSLLGIDVPLIPVCPRSCHENGSHPLNIVIGGLCPGVGKTTLMRLLADRLGAEAILEEYEKNTFLAQCFEKGLSDEDRSLKFLYAQLWFILNKRRQTRQPAKAEIRVTDVWDPQDTLYAVTRTILGQLHENDFETYRSKVQTLRWDHVQRPDLFIFLTLPTDGILNRIEARGRSFEQDDIRFFMTFMALQQLWLDSLKKQKYPLMEINTGEINFTEKSPAGRAVAMWGIQERLDAVRLARDVTVALPRVKA
jgi:deoxyguanosine kinase